VLPVPDIIDGGCDIERRIAVSPAGAPVGHTGGVPPDITLTWPDAWSDDLATGVHRVVHDVVADGGAVGWAVPPGQDETDAWLAGVLADVARGDGRLCVAVDRSGPVGLGSWRRDQGALLRHRATATKIMARPDRRGLGIGRLVTSALVDDARAAGIETLHLASRGNNLGAIALYEDLGFTVWGILPDAIEVADERYDEVHLSMALGRPAGVRLRGSGPGGPGSSPRPAG